MNGSPRQIDLLIQGGTILCMDAERRVLEGHCIAIDKGRILEICPDSADKYLPKQSIDASDCIVMPGLINLHTHLAMTYFRGLADDLPLERWLNDYIWPLEARLLNRDFIYHAALHGAAEMIKNGITQINDMYFNMAAIADACTAAGLRAMIGEVVLDNGNGSPKKREFGSMVLEYRQRYADNPLIDFCLTPHSIYACSRDSLEQVVHASRKHNILLHMHLSETSSEVEQCQKERGCKPVQYLKEIGMLDCPAIYAHGIWLDEEEIDLLSGTPSSIAICTDSNLKLASGILPLASYLKKGINACFATDGVASNNNLDILAEMDCTAKLHKAITGDPCFLPAPQVLAMATVESARALGVERRRGSLEAGKDADICILSLNGVESQPLYNPYSQVVYNLGSKQVRDVVIQGEVVLRHGLLQKLDEAELLGFSQQYQNQIKAELKL